jgi:tricorn protease
MTFMLRAFRALHLLCPCGAVTSPPRLILLLVMALAALRSDAAAAEGALGYYRQPDVHGERIVLVAEGDLWTVPVAGGLAERLTSHPGDESHPAISPDGRQVAFIGTYEGPPELYVIPMAGGLPQRVTFDGTAIEVIRWVDEQRVLFSSRGRSTLPNVQLFTAAVRDPLRPVIESIPLWQAADGVFTDRGALVFTRQAFQGSHAKRYRGGTVQQLWRWDGGEQEARGLTTDYPGTSRQPMWWNGRVWFASDRDGTMNIWSMDRDGGDLRQHTQHEGWDVLWPAMHGSADQARIVYQLGADLRVLELRANGLSEDRALAITLRSDLDQLREQWIAKPADYITSSHPSPDGQRVVITARGRVFVAPAKLGRLVEVDRDSAVRWRDARFVPRPERKPAGTSPSTPPATPPPTAPTTAPTLPAPSPDPAPDADPAPPVPAAAGAATQAAVDPGLLVALSDRTGEVEVWTLPANGVGVPPNEPRQRTRDGSVLRWFAIPSPDGTLVAHTDKNQRLWLLDLQTEENRMVTQSNLGDIEDVAWAPDSRWLTFTQRAGNLFRQVILCRVEDLSLTPLTTDRFDSYSACWTPDGDWIYLLSDRHLETVVTSPWGAYQPEPFMARTGQLYALSLKPQTRFPFQAPDELQPPAAAKDADTKGWAEVDAADAKRRGARSALPLVVSGASGQNLVPPSEPAAEGPAAPTTAPEKPAGGKVKPVEIELAGIVERLREVPVPPGRYSQLDTNGKLLLWLSGDPLSRTLSLSALEIGNQDPKVATVAEKVSRWGLSEDGSTLLIVTDSALHLVPAKAASADLAKGVVDLSGWTLSMIPRDQWRQMFSDAWRLHRDYFYDPAMHGADWNAMRRKYEPLVERVTTRAELNDLLAQMVSELSALHASVRGGDLRRGADQIRAASLGAELARDEAAGGWRVTRIFESDPDEPAGRGPLARPESRVEVGEIIERINGAPTLSVPDPALLLRGMAGRQVLLQVRSAVGNAATNPGGDRGGDLAVDLSGASRAVVVRPIGTTEAASLRYDDWTLSRRREVEQRGQGRIGYVHLRAMGDEDWSAWARGYFPVFNRDALIIDVRHNRGGNIDSWILNRLLRKAWFGWSTRIGEQPLWNMQFAFRGHVAVLCDEWTASDGEAFAEGIKRLGIGTLIGTRTWGGEIWLSGSNLLLDRGVATAAEFGVFGPDGIWLIEGHGVEPDVVVDNLPRETYGGRDRQLEAAIEHLQRKMTEAPIAPLTRPAYPVKVP